jgi:hypothetical protein
MGEIVMIIHDEYMADSAKLHQQYYLEIALSAGVRLPDHLLALANASSDPYFNDVPLPAWDVVASAYSGSISREMKKRGTFYSLATGVCVVKALARHYVGASDITT